MCFDGDDAFLVRIVMPRPAISLDGYVHVCEILLCSVNPFHNDLEFVFFGGPSPGTPMVESKEWLETSGRSLGMLATAVPVSISHGLGWASRVRVCTRSPVTVCVRV